MDCHDLITEEYHRIRGRGCDKQLPQTRRINMEL